MIFLNWSYDFEVFTVFQGLEFLHLRDLEIRALQELNYLENFQHFDTVWYLEN
jgi:hypothetical protein